MLDHSSVRILVAAHPTDSDRIIGWLAYSPAAKARLLHMVYVREHERRNGIAEMLTEHAWPSANGPIVHTVIGPHAQELRERFANAVHLPVMEFLA